MTVIEKQYNSTKTEVEKLEARLIKAKEKLEKKIKLCEKLNCSWSVEEYRRRQQEITNRHAGESIVRLGNDDDILSIKQNGAYMDVRFAKSDIEDITERLSAAVKRLERITTEYNQDVKEKQEVERINSIESKWLSVAQRLKLKQEYEEWLKQFKAECLKDGIAIYEVRSTWISGKTKAGKRFCMYLNDGYTERSYHSYTLRIENNVYFTSGLWATGYTYLLQH